MTTAAAVLARCDELGGISEEPGRLVRRYGTGAAREAAALVAGWMREAGLDVHEDAVGNLIGRRGPPPRLALGSHLDTVVDAGRYDGPLGVLAALAVAERVPGAALEVVAFADEEGARFGTAYLGSAPMAGAWDPATPERRDADGVALADVLPGDPATAARDPAELAGYVELHIEQGTVLERADVPLGVVSAIAGQTHVDAAFTGEAGHAGTVAAPARRDALAAAAELVLAAEAAMGGDGDRRELVATAGRIDVAPGVRNVIPARAVVTLDVRHPGDAARRRAVAALRERAEVIAARRGVGLDWRAVAELPAVPMDSGLAGRLQSAVAATGTRVVRLPSGAGHDAAMLARVTPAAMLFVRCAGGISHHPAESVAEEDVAVALDVLGAVVRGS